MHAGLLGCFARQAGEDGLTGLVMMKLKTLEAPPVSASVWPSATILILARGTASRGLIYRVYLAVSHHG